MVAVLSNAGDQVPVMALFEVVGKGVNRSPVQIGGTAVNVGTVGELFTVMINVAVVAHCPATGVKV